MHNQKRSKNVVKLSVITNKTPRSGYVLGCGVFGVEGDLVLKNLE